ncbi:MAG: tetratricopeptide repeat protein [Anaerolineae bacterium]|nr:tetratricopeptide repeat protein [Anaerolineae bacterium]
MERPVAYIPIDRALALARGEPLAERSEGAALFADISGFTPLTEALALELGPQRGAEELTVHLNRVYDALIGALERYGGSVIGFSGDAITCWLDGDDGRRAVAAGLAMQDAMHAFAEARTHSGRVVSLGCKVAVAAGPVRRFFVGEPGYLLVDTMAGATLEQLAEAEHAAERGQVVVHAGTAAALEGAVEFAPDSAPEPAAHVALALRGAVPEMPWPAAPELAEAVVGPWLLPPVRERLFRGAGEFLAELRPSVALFLSFAGIDYDGDPEAPRKLDAFLREVEAVLQRLDASLIQLTLGDKGSYLYAAFGSPVAHEDDPARALTAAMQLQQATERLEFLAPVRIGVAQGRMRTGAYGSASRRTYGVLGDSVNLAARLMTAAGPGEILVSSLVREAVAGEGFGWELRPPVRVKGKSEPVGVARLVGRRERRTAGILEPRYALPMVGREAELALIGAKRRLAWRGQGQVVGITAEAGLGKSRLAAEAIRLAYEQGFAGYGGECPSYGTQTPYLVWQTAWRGLFGLDPDAPPDEQIATLAERLAEFGPSLPARLPLLGPVVNLVIPDNDLTAAMDERLRKASLEALLTECLVAFARRGPLLIVLEDLHWIDPLSSDLLEQIARVAAELPVLLLLAYRPLGEGKLKPALASLPNFTEVELGEFGEEETAALIGLKLAQQLGDAAEPPPGLVQRISERANGNPFYVEELMNYLRDRQIDPTDARSWESLDLPENLYQLILTRIDQLDEQQKATLKVASVIGRLFPAAMVWGIYPELGGEEQVARSLGVLSNVDLTPLDTPDPELVYLFKHILTQQVAYESLLYATRARLHGEIGEYVEARYADRIEQFIPLLAHHYDRSENLPKRREYLVKAGELAQAAYDNMSAAEYYRRALPLLDGEALGGERVRVTFKLAQALDRTSRFAEAAAAAEEGLAVAERLDDALGISRMQRVIGWLRWKLGDYPGARVAMEAARSASERAGDAELLAANLLSLGDIQRLQSRFTEARAFYEQSGAVADIIRDERARRTAQANALASLQVSATWQGQYDRANALAEEVVAIRRDLGDKPGIAGLLTNASLVERYRGNLAVARKMNDEALTTFRELGDRWSVAQLLNNQACVASDQGKYGDARRMLDESLLIRRQLGDRPGLALSLNTLADLLVDQGDFASARPALAESLTIYRQLGDRTAIAYLVEDYAAIAAGGGDAVRALRLAGFAAELRRQAETPLSPAEQARLDRLLAPAREGLEPAEIERALAEGAATAPDEALELAMQ